MQLCREGMHVPPMHLGLGACREGLANIQRHMQRTTDQVPQLRSEFSNGGQSLRVGG